MTPLLPSATSCHAKSVSMNPGNPEASRESPCDLLVYANGYSFVHYSTGEAATAAIKAVDGMLLNDKKVFVGLHVGKKERQSKAEVQRAQFTNVFVKNVDAEATDEQFEKLFKPFGAIVSAALGKGEDGANKG